MKGKWRRERRVRGSRGKKSDERREKAGRGTEGRAGAGAIKGKSEESASAGASKLAIKRGERES
eukprot:1571971-Pleurochrysis_carterae.AAC.2